MKLMKSKAIFEIALISILFLLSVSLAAADDCKYIGEQVGQFYCDDNLTLQALKPDLQACVNDFECINGTCLEGFCSAGFEAELSQRQKTLEDILNDLMGQLPAGATNINSSSPAVFTLTKTISKVTIYAKAGAKTYAYISYEEFGRSRPSLVTKSPPGIVYKYFDLSFFGKFSDMNTQLDRAEVEFKLPLSWFENAKTKKDTLAMYQWNDDENKWIKLVVNKTAETSTDALYKTTVSHFSVFAITAEMQESATTVIPGTATTTAQTVNPQIGKPTCDDGIMNQGEKGVDCGGPCEACPSVCGNGIVESDETCRTCALDYNCANNEDCVYKRCVKRSPPYFWIGFAILVVGAIAFFVVKGIKKKGEQRKAKIEQLSSIIKYSTNAIKAGQKEDELKENLKKTGWKDDQIKLAIEVAKKEAKKEMKKQK